MGQELTRFEVGAFVAGLICGTVFSAVLFAWVAR